MNADYESGRAALVTLLKTPLAAVGTRNEATVRLQLIDALFFQCLGWSKADCIAEEPHGKDFADYTFNIPRRALIVEAKKEGISFELPAGLARREYSLPSLIREYPEFKAAIQQAAGYCQTRGVPFGAVTNGHQIVAFIANRNDGTPPLDGKAIVFKSLDDMLVGFREFWNSLSRQGIESKWLQKTLVGDILPEIPPKLSASILDYPGVKNRNIVQTELQILSEMVLEDLTRSPEIKKDFLRECYCPSGAIPQYAMLAKNILAARYSALFDSSAPGPTTLPANTRSGLSPDLLAESLSRRPVLLLGDVGVGKTTFLDFLTTIEAATVFQDAVSIYLDLGSRATLTQDLRGWMTNQISEQLLASYKIDIFERQFVRGVYNLDLRRFERGIYSDLRATNPSAYSEKELVFLEQKISRLEEHLAASLQHISKGQNKQIVIIIDNADQRVERDYEVQQHAFLIAQEMAQHWPAMVFVALRPETFHRSSKSGALSGYHPKAFTIAPPRLDLVLEKRLAFARKLCKGKLPIPSIRGRATVQLETLDSVLLIFLRSIRKNPDLLICLENVSGGNVRMALDIVRGFFGSGHVDTKGMIESERGGGGREYVVPLHQFLRALMHGDNEFFTPERSPVANIFDLSSIDSREHFLVPLLIAVLKTSASALDAGFVETAKVYDRLQGFGFVPDQIDSAIIRSHGKRLIDTVARRIPQMAEMPPALRPTTVGVYHAYSLSREFTYIDSMIVDTPIVDSAVRAKISVSDFILERLDRCVAFLDYLDEAWKPLRTCGVPWEWLEFSTTVREHITSIRPRAEANLRSRFERR